MSQNCEVHSMTLDLIKDVKDQGAKSNEVLQELRDMVNNHEQALKSAHKRLDDVSDQTKAILKVAGAVEYMAKQVEDILKLSKEHDSRIGVLEHRPDQEQAADYKKLKWLFVAVLIAEVGAFASSVIF